MEWAQIRIPIELFKEIENVLERTPYWTGPNEFARDAIREKLGKCQNEIIVVEPAKKEAR